MKLMIAAGIGLAFAASGTAYAYVMQDVAAQLRASGQVGEQPDGYLGAVGSVSADVRAQMDSVNIQRRARYTQLASQRPGTTIEEVAAATGCELLSTRVAPGQYYRLPSGVWKQREGSEPVIRPGHCG
jgi:uncharacterized protein YdbL (DUF1318 family)